LSYEAFITKAGEHMEHIVTGKGLVYEYFTQNEKGEIENRFRALDDLNIEIEKGQFVVILGHNGSGKSTLAKHMNAILHPTGGTLLIKGMDTKDERNLWHIRQNAGMVFQNPDNQIIAAIVEEDVAFGPENLGVKPEKIRKRVNEALAAVQMTEYMTHSPNLLSGGQKQRIAIAGVMAMRPECIILDEPTAMLDPVGRKEVMETIHRLNKEENITIIHITHYMEEAIHADRVVVMDHGKIVMDGTPREIFSQVETLKNLGLDVPQVTELAYYMQKQGIDISTEILTIEEMVDAIWQLSLKK